MQRFEIPVLSQVKLDHAKGRKEHHGEALVLALDLSITWTTNNLALDMFGKQVRKALFLKLPADEQSQRADDDDDDDDPSAGQTELDLPVSDRPFLRLQRVKMPLKLDHEYTGWTLHHDFGTGGESNVVVKLCKLKSFEITPIEGGSVEIKFSLSSAADITGEMVGHFSALIQEKISITLLGPNKTDEDKPIDASSGSGAPGTEPAPGSAVNGDATTLFIAAHGGTPGGAEKTH